MLRIRGCFSIMGCTLLSRTNTLVFFSAEINSRFVAGREVPGRPRICFNSSLIAL